MGKSITILGDSVIEIKKMADKSVDHVFTSPPYNRKRNDKYDLYDDTLVDYLGFLRESIRESIRVSRKYAIFNIQKNYYNKNEVFQIIGEFSNELVEMIIWEKKNPMPAAGNAITNSYEYFLIFGKIPLKSNTTYTKNIISTGVNSKMPKEHKAIMKQEVADFFIEKFTKPGEIVLDPFAGLFTTAISCIKFGREYIMIEKEKGYYEMGIDRLKNNL